MTTEQRGNTRVSRYLRAIFGAGIASNYEQSDAQLLERFRSGGGDDAELSFALLVERHGPMVLRTCRAILRDDHDVQDTFQAVFLVLVRKSSSLWVDDSLGPWLHAVALRVAISARESALLRRTHEQRAAERKPLHDDSDRASELDVGPVIHEEIGRLPEAYRKAVVVCDLEGLSHEEAARRLEWPVGTVKSRQARGRDKLRGRLSRRGLAPTASGIASLLAEEASSASVPARLVDSTARVAALVVQNQPATGLISTATLLLSQAALRTMMINRIKIAASVFLLLGSVSAATAWTLRDQGRADPPEQKAQATTSNLKEFELKLVGPDGKPIAGAEVELRGTPRPSGEQIRRGTFVRADQYGMVAKADAEGRLTVEIPRTPERFNVSISAPGYGSYWTGWSSEAHSQPIPAMFTAELDAAWTVGGIVVDPAGKPVAGAKVRPNVKFKKRPGDPGDLYIGDESTTDASGGWHFDRVPASMDEIHVAIDHPNFMPLRRILPRKEFGINHGQQPSGKIVLNRGLTVTGKITDEAGRPIAGVLVRTNFRNQRRKAKTRDDGTYTLAGCEPQPARIVASAKGWSFDLKELNIEPEMGPVDFVMKPGNTVRVRVFDHEGKPAPKARIFFQWWRNNQAYFELEHVNQYADDNGLWVWNEAPADEFQADINSNAHDQMNLLKQHLVARAEEYVFRLPPPLVVSGKVIDAQTRVPIQEFRVVPGVRWDKDSLHWNEAEGFKVTGGRYETRQTRGEFAHLVRIEAEGYRSAVSRDIKSNEGAVTLDFALTPAKDIIAKVVTPQNASAKGAKVAIGVAGSQIIIKNGEFTDQTYAALQTTDDSGRFQFPAQDKNFQLIILHPSGYAHVKSPAAWPGAKIIRLEPWARVEGTFRVGPRLAANVPLSINTDAIHSNGPRVANIFTRYKATTGPDGHFVFERVFPGRGFIGREITFMVDEGATEVTSSCRIQVDLPGGKTTHLNLGGTGRSVIGKLLPHEGFAGKPRWNFATIWVRPAEGGRREEPLDIRATVDRDGTFRIDDVPPGKYAMLVHFDREDAGHLGNHPFEVPADPGNKPVEPIDLGSLKLQK